MPSKHLEQIRVRTTPPQLYGLADKMRRVGERAKSFNFTAVQTVEEAMDLGRKILARKYPKWQRYWCDHKGGWGPPFPYCITCSIEYDQ